MGRAHRGNPVKLPPHLSSCLTPTTLAEIAEQLHVSNNTVLNHIRNAYEKGIARTRLVLVLEAQGRKAVATKVTSSVSFECSSGQSQDLHI